MIPSKFVKAIIKLKSSGEGGKLSGILPGYSPNHVFEYKAGQMLMAHIGEIQWDDGEWIMPGEQKKVTIEFVLVPEVEKYLTVGRKWWIHEGPKVVGEAEIIEV